jgi:hypothetical protein
MISANFKQISKCRGVGETDCESMRGKRPDHPIDWDRIEREYRAGQLSVSEIAAIHQISRALIQRRARQKGWKRDLAAKVRRAVAEKIVADVAPDVAATDEAATVEFAANRGADIMRLHQRRAARLNSIVEVLAGELETSDLPVTAKSTAANNLANALRTLTTVERQAFGLDADNAPGNGNAPLSMSDLVLEVARRREVRKLAAPPTIEGKKEEGEE